MKIISFPSMSSTGRYVEMLNEKLQEIEGAVRLIFAEHEMQGHNLSEFIGIDLALKQNPEEYPIILCSFMPESYFRNSKEFQNKFNALLGKKRTAFIRLPFTTDEFVKKYSELIGNEKTEDTLALEINKAHEFQMAMGTIQHRAKRFLYEEDKSSIEETKKAVEEARAIGVTGTNEEVVKQIHDFEYKPMSSFLVGKFYPGVFCDVEDTLIINNEVNIELLAKLHKLSFENPITIWTGGDKKEISKKLTTFGITWKLISKYDMAGSEVEIAFDDKSQEEIEKTYGVKIRNFHRV